jgi:hypothetical protein
MTDSNRPFSTIESAHEFLALLGETIDDALHEVREELEACSGPQQQRKIDALQVVFYTTTKLSSHVATSRRLLNDLRTLRNLLQRNNEAAGVRAAKIAQDATTRADIA